MKKILFIMMACLLCACGVEDSPEAHFDAALTMVETASYLETKVDLKGESFIARTTNETHVTEVENKEVSKELACLTHFDLLSNTFNKFTYEKRAEGGYEIHFVINQTEQIKKALDLTEDKEIQALMVVDMHDVIEYMTLSQDNQELIKITLLELK